MTSHGLSRRSVLTMAPLGALGVALAVSNAPQAKAEELSTYWIQRDLIYFGFLPIGSDDGIYGAQTTEAVRWMQYRAGLEEDGIAGPETQQALFDRVLHVQERVPGCEADGYAGPDTFAKTAEMQTDNGLPATVVCDDATLKIVKQGLWKDPK